MNDRLSSVPGESLDDAPTRVDLDPSPPAHDAPLFSRGERLAGRWRIERFIASGGMGEVYEAEDEHLHQRVALKAVRPHLAPHRETLDRFRREINLARRVTHPNVCRIYDIGLHGQPEDEDCVRFLTMELLHGETLSRHLGRVGRLPTEEALPIVEQICDGLAAAHDAGVIHRDFKPSNVMLCDGPSGPRAVITDFGLSKPIDSEMVEEAAGRESSALTNPGQLIGTLAYLAPEQLEGEETTPKTDLYALGAVMYQMVTGELPFEGKTALARALRRLDTEPTDPVVHCPDLDPKWRSALLRTLDRSPKNRHESAGALARELRGDERPWWRAPSTLAVAAVLLFFLGFGVSRVPLGDTTRVVVFPPRIDSDVEIGDFDQATFETAIERTLGSLEGIELVHSEIPVDARTRLLDYAKLAEAEEVIVLDAQRRAGRWDLALERILVASGEKIAQSEIEPAPDDDRYLQSLKLTSMVSALYPGVESSVDYPLEDITKSDWEQYLQLHYTLNRTTAPLPEESTRNQLASLRETYPDWFDVHLLEAQFFAHLVNRTKDSRFAEEGLEALERAAALSPNEPDLLEAQVMMMPFFGAPERAAAALQVLERSHFSETERLEAQVWAARDKEDFEEAARLLEQVVRLDPRGETRIELAGYYVRLQEYERARELVQEILERDPENEIALSRLAEIELGSGNLDAADELYKRLNREAPGPGTLNNQAATLVLQGNHESAYELLLSARERYPRHPYIVFGLAEAAAFTDRPALARRFFEEALEVIDAQPPKVEMLMMRVQVTAFLGDREATQRTIRTLSELPREDPGVLYGISVAHALLGDNTAARSTMERATELGFGEEWFELPWFSSVREGPSELEFKAPIVEPPT
ncbi:MAG: protein kinase [Acidobacteriota bacterium]